MSHHEGSAHGNGGARIVVRALDAEELPEFVALAWTSDGSMLAALRRKPGAMSEVVLVRQDSAGRWQRWKRIAVDSDAIGGRIKFIDASTLYIRGPGTESAVFAIRKDRLEKLKSLPNQIDAENSADGLASVEDWSCIRR